MGYICNSLHYYDVFATNDMFGSMRNSYNKILIANKERHF